MASEQANAVPIKSGDSESMLSPKMMGIIRLAVAVLLITEDITQATLPNRTISRSADAERSASYVPPIVRAEAIRVKSTRYLLVSVVPSLTFWFMGAWPVSSSVEMGRAPRKTDWGLATRSS